MSEEEYRKMEVLAKSVLRVADTDGWSESDISRQLAVLALKAAQQELPRRLVAVTPKNDATSPPDHDTTGELIPAKSATSG